MDSVYMTGLSDGLSLQDMLDCDIKTEMEIDDCFSLGDLPPLALDDSLDVKWDLLDPANTNHELSFPSFSHSPSSDLNLWFNADSSANSILDPNILNMKSFDSLNNLQPHPSMMVDPNCVMPNTTASKQIKKSTPVVVTAPSAPQITTTASTITVTSNNSLSSPQVTNNSTPNAQRAKISRANSINIVCNQTNGPITIVRPRNLSTNSSTVTSQTIAAAVAQTENIVATQIRSPTTAASRIRTTSLQLSDAESKCYPKPAYSYSCLIALALKNSVSGSLPVSEIYNFMCQHFPYFKTAPNGWKNSVRHNLSLNKCFEKIEKPSGNGSQRKGCLWAMNPSKLTKMDEEVQKWSRKDPQAIRRAMVFPDTLEQLERGDMKFEVASSSQHSGGEDTEDTEEDDDSDSPPVSPAQEQPMSPPPRIKSELMEVDPLADDSVVEHNMSDYEVDANDAIFTEYKNEKVNIGININPTAKIEGNYILKPSPNKMSRNGVLPIQSYICKAAPNGVQLKKMKPTILLAKKAS